MKAVVSVIGKDRVGIIAKVSGALSEMGANIEDISQTVLQDYFVMIMLADLTNSKPIGELNRAMDELGKHIGVSIKLQHEDIFNIMHRI